MSFLQYKINNQISQIVNMEEEKGILCMVHTPLLKYECHIAIFIYVILNIQYRSPILNIQHRMSAKGRLKSGRLILNTQYHVPGPEYSVSGIRF
uniref:Uncharacterized protein n=1 Tax=Acrobeloides nanus TaxID=290746 RepID=A0A914DU23_9BILA